jgi:tetratricopeptide (TPR) repeat protein
MLLLALVAGGGAPAQQVTFTFNQDAPLSPIPKSERELDEFLLIEDEANPERRLRLTDEFLGDFFDSEFRHLVLRLRFHARYQLDDWGRTVEAAREALAAEEYFEAGKLGFIDDPGSVASYPSFRLDLANQKSIYYQALNEGYRELGDRENSLMYGEMALDALDEAWSLYAEQNDPSLPQYAEAERRHKANEELLLRGLLSTHRAIGNTPQVIEFSKQLLEVRPDDLEILMTLAQTMTQNVPQEGRGPFLEEAAGYATRAVTAMEEWVVSEASASVNEDLKAEYLAEAHSNVGLIHFQTGNYAGAAAAFEAATRAAPGDGVLYYRLGVAHNNSQNVDGAVSSFARAVFLGVTDARPLLEAAYQVKNGNLEGLDDFIRNEGEQTAQP